MSSPLSIPSPKTVPHSSSNRTTKTWQKRPPTKTGQVPLRLLALIKCDDNQEKSLSEGGGGMRSGEPELLLGKLMLSRADGWQSRPLCIHPVVLC